MVEVRMMFLRSLPLLLLASVLTPAVGETISVTDATNHVGESATVCGKVASERYAAGSRGEPTFTNLDTAYSNQTFTILVWGKDRTNVGDLPREGSRVCATGVIQEYKGVPEIVVRNSGQIGH
jgi:DNA/RNA endonuclease YhcR with UshA esterase domain